MNNIENTAGDGLKKRLGRYGVAKVAERTGKSKGTIYRFLENPDGFTGSPEEKVKIVTAIELVTAEMAATENSLKSKMKKIINPEEVHPTA